MSLRSEHSFQLLADPSPEIPGCRIRSLTSLFDEVGPGLFEAICDPEEAAGGHWFLTMKQVGCKALLYASASSCDEICVSHYGSFTDWTVDLTALFQKKTGQICFKLKLEEDCKTLSPYQKAGILGDILLIHVPDLYLEDLFVTPLLEGENWYFQLSCRIGGLTGCENVNSGCRLVLHLFDAASSELFSRELELSQEEILVRIPVSEPKLWNPEAPYLYGLTAELWDSSGILERCEKNCGLRRLEKQGQQILWNKKPLKLKGLAYREPLRSELFDPADDLRRFAEAGVNYLRSLYYPFSSYLLNLCDQAGILVEQSAPVEEVGQALPANQNAPALRPLFLSQYREMVSRDRSHPCILLWSLGSNCVWGDQFRQGMRLIRSLDKDRLINFHLPMTIPADDWMPDVWSLAYSAWNLPAGICYDQMVIFHTQGSDDDFGYAVGKAQDYRIPVLHDAYALVPVYDRDAIEEEDGIHDFWGESMFRSFENIRRDPAALGGAVMAAVDEDGSFHPSLKQYCYGILDKDHQPKPEYWHLKMTYLQDPFVIEEGELWLTAVNSRISCTIDKKTGLIASLIADEKKILEAGPFLHTGRFRLGTWTLSAFSCQTSYRRVNFVSEGSYGSDCSVRFHFSLSESGELDCSCEILSVDRAMPHRVKAGIGLDPGGLDEYGIRFLLPADTDSLSWTGNSLWSSYPRDHIGRGAGEAVRTNLSDFTSRKVNLTSARIGSPTHLLRLFCSGSQNLRLKLTADSRCFFDDRFESSSARDRDPLAAISWQGDWHLTEDPAGIANTTESLSDTAGSLCKVSFTGSGLRVFGSTDRIRGCCDIFLDGRLIAEQISQHTPAVQIPAMSRGYEKRHHRLLFEIDGLPCEKHECVIVVTGTKEPASQGAYISIDSFEIIHPDYPDQVSLIFNQDYNYPRLTQGNYMRPAVHMKAGDVLSCRMMPESLSQTRKPYLIPADEKKITIRTCSESISAGCTHTYTTADFN